MRLQKPITPCGTPIGEWLDRRVLGGRSGKDRSGPAISSACYTAPNEIGCELERRRGHLPSEMNHGKPVGIAVAPLREHEFDRQGAERYDTSRGPGGYALKTHKEHCGAKVRVSLIHVLVARCSRTDAVYRLDGIALAGGVLRPLAASPRGSPQKDVLR